ncbi:lipopolysaccharide heptosyltransferase II [Thermosporothrix hazakensis]|uniref:Lipopolysaccharide heptosyltransferase II n=2 Tax=Thermosporothrix hazakensis TaxID=644383 RepID=A0A326U3X4_THEHA|nr:glycosyltransferase family 9 protein [Thermosporothrix hazakensis]PZW26321.1 lipopolysaccharide heptosyltransferase II [Thermosporothrix hazakensis]
METYHGRENAMLDERWRSVRKVLLVRLDNLGDVLLMTPAFHAVRQALPHASITLLAGPVGAQVGRLDPDLDSVLVYQAPWMDPWHKLPLDAEREQRMIARLKEERFDGAIIFTSFRQSSLPAAYLCYLVEIPLRVAASIDGPGSLLTTRHKHPERMMHEVQRGLDLVSSIGMTTQEQDLVLRVPQSAREEIQQRLSPLLQGRPFIVVHPGCSMPARTYPPEMYAQVINLLIERLQVFVAVTGGPEEQELVEGIVCQVAPENRASVLPLAGVLPFDQLCALIQQAALTVTNNTGPMHISAAVKTPVVALFALTNPPEQWGPWRVAHRLLYHDVPCRICYSRICPYQHECLRLVSPEQVVMAANELLTGAPLDEETLLESVKGGNHVANRV